MIIKSALNKPIKYMYFIVNMPIAYTIRDNPFHARWMEPRLSELEVEKTGKGGRGKRSAAA